MPGLPEIMRAALHIPVRPGTPDALERARAYIHHCARSNARLDSSGIDPERVARLTLLRHGPLHRFIAEELTLCRVPPSRGGRRYQRIGVGVETAAVAPSSARFLNLMALETDEEPTPAGLRPWSRRCDPHAPGANVLP